MSLSTIPQSGDGLPPEQNVADSNPAAGTRPFNGSRFGRSAGRARGRGTTASLNSSSARSLTWREGLTSVCANVCVAGAATLG